MSKVPIQKGRMIANPPTIGQASREQQVSEAIHEQRERKRAQTLDLHEPKTRKK